MLNIVVFGHGLIPRGHGLAPKKEPFPADLNLINVILGTPGLRVRAVNPITGKLIPVTTANVLKVWNTYSSKNTKTPVEARPVATPTIRPAVPERTEREYTKPVEPPKNNNSQNDVAQVPAEEKKEEKRPENNNQKKDEKKSDNSGNKNNENKGPAPLKPINNPDA